MKVKGKTAARNNILKKLSNTKWGTSPSTIKTTALALSYSTAEYACPVWERSTHAEKIDPVLNEACRLITGCLKPTKVESLYQLAGIASYSTNKTSQIQKELRTLSPAHNMQPLREQIICMDQPPTVYTHTAKHHTIRIISYRVFITMV